MANCWELACLQAELTIPSLLLLLAVAPPLLLSGRPRAAQPGARPPSAPRLRPGLTVASVVLVVAAVLAARFAVFDVARFLLDRRPSEALVAGLLVSRLFSYKAQSEGAGGWPAGEASISVGAQFFTGVSGALLMVLLSKPARHAACASRVCCERSWGRFADVRCLLSAISWELLALHLTSTYADLVRGWLWGFS